MERDLIYFFIPPREFWVEEVKNFIFPLWNPYYFNGHPLFATLQPGVLYPFSFLFLILPFDWAFNLNIELHFILSGLFTYYLARGIKASQGASIISGMAFMLSGYLISVHNLLSTLLSVTWVPLFFLVYFSALKKNSLGLALISGLVGTFMFLGGGVEVSYLTFGITFVITLLPELILEKEMLPDIKRRLFLYLVFCLTFFGLSAVQLIPFMELSQLSIRSEGLTYKQAGTWSMHPFDLVEFFIPDQYGMATDPQKYWKYENWLKTIYMGAASFILAVFYVRFGGQRAKGLLLLFFISVGFALGSNTLFHHFLFDYLPFFNKLRYPVKFIFLAILILSLAAGLGYDYFKKQLEGNDSQNQKKMNSILTLGFLFMIAFGVLSLFNDPIVTYLKGKGWDYPEYNHTALNLLNIKRLFAFTSLFCLSLFLYSKPVFKKPFMLVLIVSIFGLDLFYANWNFYGKMNYKKYQELGENPKFIKSDPEFFRIYVDFKTRKREVKEKSGLKGIDLRKEKFLQSHIGKQQIMNADGVGVTEQKRFQNMINVVKIAPNKDSTQLLNLMNVKYVISMKHIASPDYELVHSYIPIPKDPEERKKFENSTHVKIYENKKVIPRAFLVPNCRVITSDKQYNDVLQSKIFDPTRVVLLDVEPKGFPCGEEKNLEILNPVTIDSYKSNSVELSVDSSKRQLLFMSESFYPGWKVYVNGEEKEILRANYLFRAIVVEPGKHSVRFEYDPFSFKLGLAITILTILLCGIYFIRRSLRRVAPVEKFSLANK